MTTLEMTADGGLSGLVLVKPYEKFVQLTTDMSGRNLHD